MSALPQAVFDPAEFEQQYSNSDTPVPLLKAAIKNVSEYCNSLFDPLQSAAHLIHLRADFFDQLLAIIWRNYAWPDDNIELIAVGGYGRGELHPHSDIDLLILFEKGDIEPYRESVEAFITLLWDLSLDIGHSVRTIEECTEAAAGDITIATNLMESRTLAGSGALHDALMAKVGPDKIWISNKFFRAKWDEQIARHRKHANTEYNLEPNVKSSPGGLRDIQMIGWVAKRHFGAHHMSELQEQGFLRQEELDLLNNGQDFLWRVRYALHLITGREEDRLLFDHQRILAEMFGYQDDDAKMAVEQFMQQYYRWAMALGQLNDVMMQHFDETILRACESESILEINPRFRVRNGHIEAANDKVFEKTPSALLEVFMLMAQNENIDGVRAHTIRMIRDHRDLIDDDFRNDPRNTRYFMEVLRANHKVALQLRRMLRFGILGKYLPEFGNIVGQMQHDLFHTYTVDAHTMEVIKNMRRFHYPDHQKKFPVAARVVKRLPKIELLYVAGLYHDIAKGRGGDHSTLGGHDARDFCERHGLNKRDTNLVVWLVEKHLLMSAVAQRQDISDPEIIQHFALEMGDQLHLDYLFALTVADINATNPTLWNNWRASLLRQLYAETKRALRRGLENTIDKHDWIEETQRAAIDLLEGRGFDEDEINELWAHAGEDYFLREKTDDIAWHMEAIAQHNDLSSPLVIIKESSGADFEGGTQIFVHTINQPYVFAVMAAALEQLDLSIQDARIYGGDGEFTMDTFFVLEADGTSIGDNPERLAEIHSYLQQQLQSPESFPDIVQRRTPRQMRFFSVPTETLMTTDISKGLTVLEVISPDRPGLLARIGKIFVDFDIHLQNAKIATLGEKVEDVFFVTDAEGHPIKNSDTCSAIQNAIREQLDEQAAQ